MNPFEAMLEILRLMSRGSEVSTSMECPHCMGHGPNESCERCGGKRMIPLSAFLVDSPQFEVEAAMIVSGSVPMAMQSSTMRQVISPMVQANRILGDEDRGPRRFDAARTAVSRCAAEDWRTLCENWIDELENRTLDP